jgi:uncharacterized protein (TIGR00369 family)
VQPFTPAVAFRAMADLVAAYQERMTGTLPGWFGLELLSVEHGLLAARVEVKPEHLAPNGYMHAGTVVTLADSCCGMGCMASLPDGAVGFTTVELKTNFLRPAGTGDMLGCTATLQHGGRTTQVWDAQVVRENDDKPVALFRCTQYLLPEPR